MAITLVSQSALVAGTTSVSISDPSSADGDVLVAFIVDITGVITLWFVSAPYAQSTVIGCTYKILVAVTCVTLTMYANPPSVHILRGCDPVLGKGAEEESTKESVISKATNGIKNFLGGIGDNVSGITNLVSNTASIANGYLSKKIIPTSNASTSNINSSGNKNTKSIL